MSVDFFIPDGEKKVKVELTVKEALALSEGSHFSFNGDLSIEARKKIKKSLEDAWVTPHTKIDYTDLKM